jgi:hypothetical protein
LIQSDGVAILENLLPRLSRVKKAEHASRLLGRSQR